MGNDMYNDEQLADAKARAQTSDFLPDYEFGNVLGRIPVSEHSREACRILRAHDAAFRLALETATKERDGARAAAAMNFDRATAAERERDAAVALIREVAASGVEFEDERVRYVAVQIDRETWVGVRALSQKGAPE